MSEHLADRTEFLAAMRRVSSSVVVVATGRVSDRSGCTVTAACSLSDAPPSVLVCLNRKSSALAHILTEGTFSVNYLGGGQHAIADAFAGRFGVRGEDKFSSGVWRDVNGVPVLQDALANFVCRVADVHEFGTHDIILGVVDQVDQPRGVNVPLLYGAGAYHQARQVSDPMF